MCNEIVLEAFIHCGGCKNKVTKCLRGFHGVCEVEIDMMNNKVTVRGKNMDPLKVLRRLRKKYSTNVELISPIPHNEEPTEDCNTEEDPIKLKVVVLRVNMHCNACAIQVKRELQRMTGVMEVEANMENSDVTVKGNVDPQDLVEYIKKKLGKFAEIESQEILTCKSCTCYSCCCCCRSVMEVEEAPIWECNLKYPSNLDYYYRPCICISDTTFSDENPHSCSLM